MKGLQTSNFGYEAAVAWALGKGLEKNAIQPDVLIYHEPLTAKNSSVKFQITGAQRTVENKSANFLKLKDAFFGTHIGLGITRVPVKMENGVRTPQFGNARTYFFADERVFTGAAPANSWARECDALNTVYTGKMDLQIEKKTTLEDLPTGLFEHIPVVQTQLGSTGVPALMNSSKRFETIHLGKTFGFFGDKDAHVEVRLGDGEYAAVVGNPTIPTNEVGYENYLTWICAGFVIDNACAPVRING